MFEKNDVFVDGQLYAFILKAIDVISVGQVYTRVESNQLSMLFQKNLEKITSRLRTVLLKLVQIWTILEHHE